MPETGNRLVEHEGKRVSGLGASSGGKLIHMSGKNRHGVVTTTRGVKALIGTLQRHVRIRLLEP